MASSADSSVTLELVVSAEGTVSSYWLEAGSAPGLSDLAKFSTGTAATTFSASGVANGTYYVRMKSLVGGTMSAPSNEIAVTLGARGTSSAFGPYGISSRLCGDAAMDGQRRGTAVAGCWHGPGPGRHRQCESGQHGDELHCANVAPGIYYGRIKAVNAW
ncbi:MAG: hypothetical protein U1F56_21650 [Rubrivivax sp.]